MADCSHAGGVVEEVGSGVMKEWKKGDRIAGFVHGGNEAEKEDGMLARGR
jgi:NADPH:quinone reductase-like Zn-dependent oxidoreductase